MAETIKVNFALQTETVEKLEQLCKLTYRSKSDVIDYLVAQEYLKQSNIVPAGSLNNLPIERGC